MANNTVIVSILAETSKFKKELDGAGNATGGFTSGMKGLAVAGAAAFAAVGVAAGAWAISSFKAVAEVERLNAQTAAAIKSTGAAAGRSVEQLNSTADAIERLTGIEAESVANAQNMLLTFTQIKGDNFDAATKAATDLSVAMGSDMQSAATLVGKALNDPIKGIGALSKVGVQLTEDQKAMIASMVEVGDVAGAQGVILGELNTQFGGSAEAFGNTFLGAMEKVKNSFGNIGETLVQGLLPGATAVLLKINDIFLAIGDSPALQAAGEAIGNFVSNLFNAESPIGGFVKQIIDLWTQFSPLALLFNAILPILPVLGAAFADIAKTIGGGLSDVLKQLAPLLPPLLKSLGSLASTLVTGLFTAIKPLLPVINQLAGVLVGVLGQALVALVPFITSLAGVLGNVLGKVFELLAPVIATLAGVLAKILPVIMPVIEAVLGLLTPILGLLTPILDLIVALLEPILGLISPLLEVVGVIVQALLPVISFLADALGVVIGVIATVIQFFVNLVTGGNKMKDGIATVFNTVVSFISGIPGKIVGYFNTLYTSFLSIGSNIVNGIINGVNSVISKVWTLLTDIGKKITKTFKDILGIKSPSRVFRELGIQTLAGLQQGLERTAGIQGAMVDLGNLVTDSFSPDLTYTSVGTLGGSSFGGGNNYNVTVQAIAPNAEVGRAVVEAISDYERNGGTR